MTALHRAIELVPAREYKHLPPKCITIKEAWSATPSHSRDLATVFNLTATFSAKVVVADDTPPHHAVHQARRKILRDVYGELLPLIHEAMYEATNYETDRAVATPILWALRPRRQALRSNLRFPLRSLA